MLISNLIDSRREQLPFCLFHNSFLKSFRCITIKNINSLLEYNLSCIHALIHIMNSCTCHLYAFCQSCLMDMKTISVRFRISSGS